MPVTLNGHRRPSRPSRGNRGQGFDNEIRKMADAIVAAQDAGYISPGEIASFLNDLPQQMRSRKRYTASSMRRMLARGVELGFDFRRQTRAEAGGRPRSPRRTRDQMERDMMELRLASKMRALAAAGMPNGVAITAHTSSMAESLRDA